MLRKKDAVIVNPLPAHSDDYFIKSFNIEVADNKIELLLNGLLSIYRQLGVIIDNPDHKHHVGNLRKFAAEVLDIGVIGSRTSANWSEKIDEQKWSAFDDELLKRWDQAMNAIVIEGIKGMRALGSSVTDIGTVVADIFDLHVDQITQLRGSCFAGRGPVKTIVDRWHKLGDPKKGSSSRSLFAFLEELMSQMVAESVPTTH